MSLAFALASHPLFVDILRGFAAVFDVIGVVVVVVAAFIAAERYVRREAALVGFRRFRAVDVLRYNFGQRMILGLEFFLAGDIVRLIVIPTLEGLIRLGVIVAVRTVLSYALTHETDHRYRRHRKPA